MMVLHIRNMESGRCKTMVRNELIKLGLQYKTLELGEVELKGNISGEKLQLFDIAMRNSGLELMNDKKCLLIEKIKAAIYQLIYLSDDLPKPNFSDFLCKKVNYDYNYLSNLFSCMQGVTIEKYTIAQKIERVKKLLVYDNLSLNDISYKLQYSSVGHLCKQFKKVTGLTPSSFRPHRNTGQS
jgi:AraC-like DNA-binding protein